MIDTIQKYFRVGTIPSVSFPGSANMAEVIRRLGADDYFSYLELDHELCSRHAEALTRYLRPGHLSLCYNAHSVAFSGNNPCDLDEDRRRAAETRLLNAVEEAHRFGAEAFTLPPGPCDIRDRADGLRQLSRTLIALSQKAEPYGMRVELELFDYDLDKCGLIGPAPLAAELAANVRESVPNFGLLVDLSHFPAIGEDSCFILRTLRPYITHFHMGNIVIREGMPSYGDNHPRFGYPASENDVKELLHFLSVLGREGFFCEDSPYPLTFEVRPQPGEDPDIVLANAKRTLNRAWSLISSERIPL
ncbi:MAG: sugar phosphate isomerase/epimerase [Firmicutes bacterium]|nr:sugar phosphate isomerase/epimerase [Bacillota bacterium]